MNFDIAVWQTVAGTWYWQLGLDTTTARAQGPFEIEALARKDYEMKGPIVDTLQKWAAIK